MKKSYWLLKTEPEDWSWDEQVKSGNIDPRDSEFSNMSKLTEKIKSLSNYQFDENL